MIREAPFGYLKLAPGLPTCAGKQADGFQRRGIIEYNWAWKRRLAQGLLTRARTETEGLSPASVDSLRSASRRPSASKGVTLSKEGLPVLKELLNGMEL